MKAIRVVSGIITLLIRMPIWFYLLYSILQAVNVDRLVWFLFWTYIPLSFFLEIVDTVVKKLTEE